MSKRAFAVILAGFLTVSIAYAIRYGYGMLLPQMLPALGITKTQAGIIYSAYFTAYTLFSPVLGLLSDRYDVRKLLTLFSALLATGSILMAWASSVLNASLFFVVAGIGHSACWAPVVALVQRWVPDNRRGTALAFATLGSGAGIAFWSLVLPLLVARLGWQAGWAGMGCAGLVVALLNYILVRNPYKAPTGGSTTGRDAITMVAYWHLLRESKLWFIGLSYLMVGFTVLVPYTFIGAYATEQLRLPYATATRLISIVAVCGIAGKIALGSLSDSIGRKKTMLVCNFLLGAGCAGIACCGELKWLLFGFCGLFGFGFGAVWPVYAAAAPDYFSKSSAGSVIGLWTVFLGVGSIISPIFCGWTIDLSGTYHLAFLSGTVSSVTAFVLLVPVKKIH